MPQAIPLVLAATAVIGTGLAIKGTIDQTHAAKQQQQANAQIAQQEQQAAAVQKQQQDLQSERYRMQVIRQQNVARSLALSNATSGGAQYGSGLQGGYGQISGEANTQLLGANQNQQLGNELYGINQGITNTRIAQAGYSANYYAGAGLSSLGGELVSSMGPIGRLAGGFGYGGRSSPVYPPNDI